MKAFLKELAVNAGKILLGYSHKQLTHTEKKQAGFVTEADIQSEQYILNTIKKHYPNSSLVAEESGSLQTNDDMTWVIDPLDGTTNFAQGIPFFAVSIGVKYKNKLKYGIIYNPVSQECFYAEHKKGFFINNTAFALKVKKNVKKSIFATGDCYNREENFKHSTELLKTVYEQVRAIRVCGSVALSLAYVAAGKFDGFFQLYPNEWDIAAGELMVLEAGGSVKELPFSGSDKNNELFMATNSGLMDVFNCLCK